MFSPELREKAEELVGRYPVGRSALLPLLHLVQSQDGYVSDDGITECAQMLGLTKAEVGAVATFYTMYKRSPMGRHLVSVCTNFSCKVRGGLEVFDRLSDKLGVGHNETTADGAVTLEHAECLGNCEGAPVVTVDYYNYECLTPDAAEELVDQVVAGDPPPPTRGFVPAGVRAIEHRLAGAGPHPDDVQVGAALGLARAEAGGLTPVATEDAGPQTETVTVEPAFTPGHAAERERAKRAVRAAGQDPDVVQSEAGPRAREFATTDPDYQPRAPGVRQAAPGPGQDESVPAEFAGQDAEDDLGAEETTSDRLGAESGAGGGHEYPPASGGEGESAEGEEASGEQPSEPDQERDEEPPDA